MQEGGSFKLRQFYINISEMVFTDTPDGTGDGGSSNLFAG